MSSKKAELSPNPLDEKPKNRHFPFLTTLEVTKREDYLYSTRLKNKNLHFDSKDVKKFFDLDRGRQL